MSRFLISPPIVTLCVPFFRWPGVLPLSLSTRAYQLPLSALRNPGVCTILSFQDKQARLSALALALRLVLCGVWVYIFVFYMPSGTHQSFLPQAPCSQSLGPYFGPTFVPPFHNSQSQFYSATASPYLEFFSKPLISKLLQKSTINRPSTHSQIHFR